MQPPLFTPGHGSCSRVWQQQVTPSRSTTGSQEGTSSPSHSRCVLTEGDLLVIKSHSASRSEDLDHGAPPAVSGANVEKGY
jgi:hypothetical protein